MKKINLLVFVFAIALTTTATAQVRLGAKAGLNIANIMSDPKEEGEKSYLGFHVGGTVDFKLTEQVSLQSGLLFSQKGQVIEEGSVKSTEFQNYLEVPVNVAYSYALGEQSKLSIFAGPYFAYALSGEIKGKSSTLIITSDVVYGGDNGQNRFDLGLNGGVNFDYSNYRVTAQYGYGLTNMDPKNAEEKSKNSVIGLSVAYIFGK